MEGGESDSKLTVIDYMVDIIIFPVKVQSCMIRPGEGRRTGRWCRQSSSGVIRSDISCDANSVTPLLP